MAADARSEIPNTNRPSAALESSPPAAKPGSPKWGLLIKILVTAAVGYWIFRNVNFAAIGSILRRADVFDCIVAIGLIGATIPLTAWRWQILLRAQRLDFSLGFLNAVTLIALFFNNFLPGSAGGDLVKVGYMVSRAPKNGAGALVSIALDRAIGLWAMLATALIAMIVRPPAGIEGLPQSSITWSASAGLLILTVSFAGIPFVPFRHSPQNLQQIWRRLPGHSKVEEVFICLKAMLLQPSRLLAALLIAVAANFLTFAGGWFLGTAIGVSADFLTMCVVLSLVITITTLPISFAGHGVRESALILLLGGYALADRDTAVAFSVLLYGSQLFWGLIGGLVYLLGVVPKSSNAIASPISTMPER